jgi:hypothetical protein
MKQRLLFGICRDRALRCPVLGGAGAPPLQKREKAVDFKGINVILWFPFCVWNLALFEWL